MIDAQRQALLDRILDQFGVELLWHERLRYGYYRQDVTTHTFFEMDVKLTEELKQEIRRYVENQGWQFSRQMVNNPIVPGRLIEYVFIAPLIVVPLDVGFHA